MMCKLVGWTLLAIAPAAVRGCSRALWNKYMDRGAPVVCGRSMDWMFSFEDYLFVVPRGIRMDGGLGLGGLTEEKSPLARWTSKYGSVVSSISGYASRHGFDFVRDGGTDGVNEAGLGVHVLYLGATEYPDRDEESDVPGLAYTRWTRYMLDNFATVAEAVEGMLAVRVLPVEIESHVLGAHAAIEDPTGDSAVFEIIAGRLNVHHGREVRIMTNDPPYDDQLKLLRRYRGFGGDLPLPGEVASEDRFVRLSYYLPYLPKPQSEAEAIAEMQSLIMNTAVPFGAPYGEDVYPTWWTSYTDVTNLVYYFNWVKNPFLIWIELGNLDFSEGNDVLVLDPKDPSLLGEVSSLFAPTAAKMKARKATAVGKWATKQITLLVVSAVSVCCASLFAIEKLTRTGGAGGGRKHAANTNTEESSLLT